MENLNTLLNTAMEKVQQNAKSPDNISGLRCGYAELDHMTGGFEGPDLIVIGARPLMGKATLLINMMIRMARDYNIPGLFYSLDMSADQFAIRVLSAISEIEGVNIKCGNLDNDGWKKLTNASSSLNNLPLLVSDRLISVEELCDNAKEAVEKHGIKVIFIDYLQLLSPKENKENRYQDIAYCTRRLKALAKDLNIPIMVTSQINRNSEYKPGRTNVFCKPEMHELRDSGTICEDADIVILLDRPELTSRDTPEYDDLENRGIINVNVAKNNNGKEGILRLRFRGGLNRIDEIKETSEFTSFIAYSSEKFDSSELTDMSDDPPF